MCLSVMLGCVSLGNFWSTSLPHPLPIPLNHINYFSPFFVEFLRFGILIQVHVYSISPDLWFKTHTTNLTGAFHTIQAAASQLSTQSPPGGSIIGISSISALVGGSQQAHYTPTKAGVLSLVQSCACALGKYNIRCNALLPGTIKTQLNEKDLEDEEKRRYMEGRIPLGRTGVPEDMVGPAVFLASGLSGYVTGAQLLVDGGLFVNLQ